MDKKSPLLDYKSLFWGGDWVFSEIMLYKVIELSSRIFILVLKNCPIRTLCTLDSLFWLAGFFSSTSEKKHTQKFHDDKA